MSTPQRQIHLRSEQSNDAVAVIELSVPGGWDGPRLHHHDFDEAFYVLEGELTFQLGEALEKRGPGTLTFAPRGSIHTLTNLSDEPARYLLVCTPGGFERRFEEGRDDYPPTTFVGPTIRERIEGGA
jgi:quercetin dioxygenase-like cupin family protein